MIRFSMAFKKLRVENLLPTQVKESLQLQGNRKVEQPTV